jgi:hypothetical protein
MMKSLRLVLSLLLVAAPALAADPVVVHNFDQPSMDASHGLELSDDLRIGGKDAPVHFGNIVHLASD